MIKQRLRLFVLLCALMPSTSFALLTPFGIEVNNAVEAGLQYLRTSQAGNGGWGNRLGCRFCVSSSGALVRIGMHPPSAMWA